MKIGDIAMLAENTTDPSMQMVLASAFLTLAMPYGREFLYCREQIIMRERLTDFAPDTIAYSISCASEIIDSVRILILPPHESVDVSKIPQQPAGYRFRVKITPRGGAAPTAQGEGNTALAAKIAAFARFIEGPSNGSPPARSS